MCGRYHIKNETYGELERILGRSAEYYDISGDIHPTEEGPVICKKNGLISLNRMIWGYPSARGGSPVINARAETIEDKPMFKHDIQYRRCVIPAAYFYEWDRYKQKATIDLPGHKICYLAGIYRQDGDAQYFTVITTKANESVSMIHDRMPLLIREEDILSWIGDSFRELMLMKMPDLNVHIENEQLSFI
ncbi:MAG: SOS response-associated peptidase family protein [Lachnospiraceae bacterium]|nr:SOS response-associated peptidase family protein [Lachnospiraceae bacterium]